MHVSNVQFKITTILMKDKYGGNFRPTYEREKYKTPTGICPSPSSIVSTSLYIIFDVRKFDEIAVSSSIKGHEANYPVISIVISDKNGIFVDYAHV